MDFTLHTQGPESGPVPDLVIGTGNTLSVIGPSPDNVYISISEDGKLTTIGPDTNLCPSPVADERNPKDIAGAKKPDLSVIPPSALLHLSMAMMEGARKYGVFNWRETPIQFRTYLAAAMRHILAVIDGEDIDPSSPNITKDHLDAAMASLAIILDARESGTLIDDRPKIKGPSPQMIRNFEDHQTFGDI